MKLPVFFVVHVWKRRRNEKNTFYRHYILITSPRPWYFIKECIYYCGMCLVDVLQCGEGVSFASRIVTSQAYF
jgi:hypothetical protein